MTRGFPISHDGHLRDNATGEVSTVAPMGAKAELTASTGDSRHGPDHATVVTHPIMRRGLHVTNPSPPAAGAPPWPCTSPAASAPGAPPSGLERVACHPSNRRRAQLARVTCPKPRRLRR